MSKKSDEPVKSMLDDDSDLEQYLDGSQSKPASRYYLYALMDRDKLLHIENRGGEGLGISSILLNYNNGCRNADGDVEQALVTAPDRYKKLERYVNNDKDVQLNLMRIGTYKSRDEANLATLKAILEFKPILQCQRYRRLKVH